MILLDAVYIHSHGGKSVLMYLLKALERNNRFDEIFVFFDTRIKINNLNFKENLNFIKVKPNHFSRKNAYLTKLNKINKVICIANIPPPIKLKNEVIIYFHNALLIEFNEKTYLSKRYINFFLKNLYIKIFSEKNYKWVVQTNYMKDLLFHNFQILKRNIKIIPFYDIEDIKFERKKFSSDTINFLCVTSDEKHKNLDFLTTAFINSSFRSKVILRISSKGQNFKDKNKELIFEGKLSKNQIIKLYKISEYLIVPSKIESFGLTILEGIKAGCNVLVSDIPAFNEICIPSIFFNPDKIEKIGLALKAAEILDYKETSSIKGKNEIDIFIKLIFNNV